MYQSRLESAFEASFRTELLSQASNRQIVLTLLAELKHELVYQATTFEQIATRTYQASTNSRTHGEPVSGIIQRTVVLVAFA